MAGDNRLDRAGQGPASPPESPGDLQGARAHRNGRIEIIEGRHLKALLKEFVNLDVLIGLPKLPSGWDERDLG